MKSLVALVLLTQIIGCTLSHRLRNHLSPRIDCNGEEAEKLADMALEFINEHNQHGYKYILNIIKDAYVLPRMHTATGEIFLLYLGLLETVCHVLDPTPAKNCDIRSQDQHAVQGICDVRIFSDENVKKVVAAKCYSEADSEDDVRKRYPNCPTLLSLNDPHVVQAVKYVLHKHNEQLPNDAYEVLEISRGQHKHDPESYYVEFAIVETNCTHHEYHDDHHHCDPKAIGEAHTGFCRATVFRSHDAVGEFKDEKFESDCIIFDAKKGHSHTHLIEHHIGKHIPSPGHNNTILDLAHSHNHTSASHESHSHEHLATVAAPVVKREAPTEPPIVNHHVDDENICPGKLRHFKVQASHPREI